MKMQITNNNNYVPPIFYQNNQANLGVAPQQPNKPPSALNASMVQRIHSVKPGCGSCGRH